jgi:hypothetical protein
MAQPQAKRTSSTSRPWMIGVIAIVVVVLLLGGLSAAGLFGGVQETPGASHSSGSGGSIHTYPVVPGTNDEWVGPRPKSGLLAVAGGTSQGLTSISTIPTTAGGTTPGPAARVTDLRGVFDFDPAWDPQRNVIAFARFQNGGSQILYAAPGIGARPDGVADQGISFKDPITKEADPGTRDHLPAWRHDGSLLFSRTRGCQPGRDDCVEDVVLATFEPRSVDYIEPISADPTTFSADWNQVKKIAIDPSSDQRILVTGRNLQSPDQEFGVWFVDADGSRVLLPGSESATYAIFGTKDAVVAIERGNEDGWGSAVLSWARGPLGNPTRTTTAQVITMIPGSDPSIPTEFAGLSSSPFSDGSYAVFAADTDGNKALTVPTILILNSDGVPVNHFIPVPPVGSSWNALIALGW